MAGYTFSSRVGDLSSSFLASVAAADLKHTDDGWIVASRYTDQISGDMALYVAAAEPSLFRSPDRFMGLIRWAQAQGETSILVRVPSDAPVSPFLADERAEFYLRYVWLDPRDIPQGVTRLGVRPAAELDHSYISTALRQNYLASYSGSTSAALEYRLEQHISDLLRATGKAGEPVSAVVAFDEQGRRVGCMTVVADAWDDVTDTTFCEIIDHSVEKWAPPNTVSILLRGLRETCVELAVPVVGKVNYTLNRTRAEAIYDDLLARGWSPAYDLVRVGQNKAGTESARHSRKNVSA